MGKALMGGSRGIVLALALCACLGGASGCDAIKSANVGLSLTADGVSITVGSPAWASQMQGVAGWLNWLAAAPTAEVSKHMPGVTSWLKSLAG